MKKLIISCVTLSAVFISIEIKSAETKTDLATELTFLKGKGSKVKKDHIIEAIDRAVSTSIDEFNDYLTKASMSKESKELLEDIKKGNVDIGGKEWQEIEDAIAVFIEKYAEKDRKKELLEIAQSRSTARKHVLDKVLTNIAEWAGKKSNLQPLKELIHKPGGWLDTYISVYENRESILSAELNKLRKSLKSHEYGDAIELLKSYYQDFISLLGEIKKILNDKVKELEKTGKK
jgi:hypothetical protein